MANTIDSFYVLYVLSTGLCDDLKQLEKLLAEESWKQCPLQIQIISLAHKGMALEDQDTVALSKICIRLN